MSISIKSDAELLVSPDGAAFSDVREASANLGAAPATDSKLEQIVRRLPDDLRALEVLILKRGVELREYRCRVDGLDQHIEVLRGKLAGLNERLKAKTSETENLRKQSDELARQSGQRIAHQERQIESLSGQLAALSASHTSDLQQRDQRIGELHQKLGLAATDLKAAQSQNQQLFECNKNLEAQVREHAQRLAKAAVTEQELRIQLASFHSSVEAEERWRQIADEVIHDGEKRVAECEERVKRLEGELAIARDRASELGAREFSSSSRN